MIPSHYDVTVQFPDGSTATINLFQMGMMAKAVQFRADHGVWPPSVGKLRLTKATICDRYFIDPRYARTYAELAETLAECHASMMAEYQAARDTCRGCGGSGMVRTAPDDSDTCNSCDGAGYYH